MQGVVVQLLTFFTELGFHVPQFPFIAHSRGWSAEAGARALVGRAADLARLLLAGDPSSRTTRGGRKAHALEPLRRLPIADGRR